MDYVCCVVEVVEVVVCEGFGVVFLNGKMVDGLVIDCVCLVFFCVEFFGICEE